MSGALDPTPYTPTELACIKLNGLLGVAGLNNEKERGISLEDHVKLMAKVPLAFEPGSRFCYGNSLDVAGRVIEVASGTSLEQFLKDRIFDPCHMADTGFYVPLNKLDRFAGMQGSVDAVAKGTMFPMPVEDFDMPGLFPCPTTNAYVQDGRPLPWPCGSAGAVSTAEDYFNFITMLLQGLSRSIFPSLWY
jgi:CubicO group peptidase (beta-lactamase class C family)